MMLASKWLEDRRFTWPPIGDGAVIITAAQMALLIDGLDWSRVRPPPVRRPTKVG
jgi:transposase